MPEPLTENERALMQITRDAVAKTEVLQGIASRLVVALGDAHVALAQDEQARSEARAVIAALIRDLNDETAPEEERITYDPDAPGVDEEGNGSPEVEAAKLRIARELWG